MIDTTADTQRMKRKHVLSAGTMVFVGTCLGLSLIVSGNIATASQPQTRLLVGYAGNATSEQIQELDSKLGPAIVDTIPELGVRVIVVPQSAQQDVLMRLNEFPQVAYAEPDRIAQAFLVPSDTYVSRQWGLDSIAAAPAWDNDVGSTSVKIAVLDTGIDYNHGDLYRKVVASKDFTGSGSALDRNGHGTLVAGVAAAMTDNAYGIAGVGFNSELMDGKVLADNGNGYYSWVAKGIVWAANNGAKVINLSLGGAVPSQTLQNAVDYAWSKGAVVVAAAGNGATSTPTYPASYRHVLSVGATDQNNARASFSDFGTWVDVAAPGTSILSTYPHIGRIDRYAYASGTSMAAPFVSGLAALVWNTASGTSAQAVIDRIEQTAAPLSGTPFADGLINAARAVAF